MKTALAADEPPEPQPSFATGGIVPAGSTYVVGDYPQCGLEIVWEKPMPKFTTDETLASWFAYHPPATPEIVDAHERVREVFHDVAEFLNELLPECPDKTVALRAVREAMYHANACIAVQQKLYGPEAS